MVKAEERIDSVVDNVRKYADRFTDLPLEVIATLVTHMDTVKWEREEFVNFLKAELGISDVIAAGLVCLSICVWFSL